MTRKPIQIAIVNAETLLNRVLIALCDDGTIWRCQVDGNYWFLVPPIPGTEKFEQAEE